MKLKDKPGPRQSAFQAAADDLFGEEEGRYEERESEDQQVGDGRSQHEDYEETAPPKDPARRAFTDEQRR